MELPQAVVEPVAAHQLGDRGRLAAGDDHAGEALEVPGQPDLDDLSPGARQGQAVLAEVALQGQDA